MSPHFQSSKAFEQLRSLRLSDCFWLLLSLCVYGVPLGLKVFSAIKGWWLYLLFGIGMVSSLAINLRALAQAKYNENKAKQEALEVLKKGKTLLIGKLLPLFAKDMCPDERVPIRANVMLIERDELYIAYSFNMNKAPDLEIRLGIRQGCAGQAWVSGEQMFGDLTLPMSPGAPPWGLNPQQQALTRDVRSIISTPIKDKGNVIGVLNFDSTEPMSVVRFKEIKSAELAAAFAEALAMVLGAG